MNKIFVILALLVVAPSAVFGADSIFTWGYGEQAHNILKSVGMMTNGGGDFTLRLAAAFGLFAFAFKIMVMGKDNTLQEFTKYILIITVVGYMFWMSKKEYLVEDQVDGYTSPSALLLPVGVGTTLSIFSSIEKSFGEGMEKYFSTPTTIGLMKSGLGFQMNVHLGSSIVNIHKAEVARSFNEYVGNCVMPAISSGSIDSNKLLNSDDLINDLRVNNSLLTNIYDANNNPTTIECSLAWDQISSDVQSDYPFMLATVGAITGSGGSATFGTDVGQVFKTMYGNASNSAQNGIIQSAIRNGLSQGIQSAALATGGDAGNLAISKAMTDSSLKSGWSQAGIAAQKTLPLQKAVFTLVLMGLIVFLALMSMVFVTMQYVKSIFMLLAVLVMWNPIAAILNFLISMQMDKTAQQVLAATGGSVQYPTYITSNLISQSAADYMAFLGFFGTLIPMFAYMLVKGGDSIASHMYSSIASGMSIAARSGAATQGLGNIQTGNVSASNRQLSNDQTGGSHNLYQNSDGSMTEIVRTNRGASVTTSNPMTGQTTQQNLIGGTQSGNGFSGETHDATGKVGLTQSGGQIVDATSPSAYSGRVEEQVNQKYSQGTQIAHEKQLAAMNAQAQQFARMTEDAKTEGEAIKIIEASGRTHDEASAIVHGLGFGHKTGTSSSDSRGSNSTNGVSTTNNTQVGGQAGAQAGTPGGGSGTGASAGVSGGASKTQAKTNQANSTTGHTSSAEDVKYTTSDVKSDYREQISKNKSLQKALEHTLSGTHTSRSSNSDTATEENRQQYSEAQREIEGYEKAKTATSGKGQAILVAALNDYFENNGFTREKYSDEKSFMQARQNEWERLSNSFQNGNAANEKEWNKSLDRVASKYTGMNPNDLNLSEGSKLESSVHESVEPANHITEPNMQKPRQENWHLGSGEKQKFNNEYNNKEQGFGDPKLVIPSGFNEYAKIINDDRKFNQENHAGSVEQAQKKYDTNIIQDVVVENLEDAAKEVQSFNSKIGSVNPKLQNAYNKGYL